MSADARDDVGADGGVDDEEDLPVVTVAERTGPGGVEFVCRCRECRTTLFPGEVERGDVVECIACPAVLEVGSVREVGR